MSSAHTPMSMHGRKGGLLANSLHLILAVVAALALIALVWIWRPNPPQPTTPEAAAYHIFFVAISTLIYLAIQAYATLRQPVGSERAVLVDILFSLLPLLVVLYAGIDVARGNLQLSIFQAMTLELWGVATTIDTIIYSWFLLRVIRRSPEITVSR